MTAYQFNQPWLSKLTGDQQETAAEFAHLRAYLRGLDEGAISLFNPNLLNATISNLTLAGNIVMAGFKLTGLGAGTTAGDSLRYEQLFGGDVTLAGNLIFNPTTKGVKGTTTNDAATAGNVGEYVVSTTTSASNAAATGTYDDLLNISLTAGDWDICGMVYFTQNTATWTQWRAAISTTSGNSGTGVDFGLNAAICIYGTTSFSDMVATIAPYRVSLSGTTTYYLKRFVVFSAGTPQTGGGRISARRVR